MNTNQKETNSYNLQSDSILTPIAEEDGQGKITTKNKAWWKEAVVYQIYPRSFQDTNGDGIGDLKGIISRLDYIKSLGVDVIWLNPIFTSPNDDNGYDISDYYNIMPEFGTMEDFENLLKEMHDRDLKLVLDLVVNHSSDEHPWFLEAKKSRTSPYYGFYHWWPAEKGEPPYRGSFFDEDGYAWKYNEATDSYYLHYFSQKQPDLNWSNPELRKNVYDIIKFWFDKGIDGFRMDAIPYIGKDPEYPVIDPVEYPSIFDYYSTHPSLHEYLQEMNREVLSKYNIMTVGEGSSVKMEDAPNFVKPEREELHMLYHFGPSEIRNWSKPDSRKTGIDYSLRELKQMFTDWDKALSDGWPVIYLGNHDQPRMTSRFGSDDPQYRDISAKMLSTFLLTMRGTPFWYAGDELGMVNIRFDTIDDYNDISTINEYKRIKKHRGNVDVFLEEQKDTSRDNGRTPMQWDDSPNAGFTTGTPWLKINSNYKNVNVADEEKDPDSPLNYFKKMMALRKENKALIYGDYAPRDLKDMQIYCYSRELEDEKFLIILNFTPKKARCQCGTQAKGSKLVICNYADRKHSDIQTEITLRPFEALVLKIEK